MVHTENRIAMAAPPDLVYRLAADVARWPELLDHYRYVRVLEDGERRRVVKMAARRDFIPVSWTSIQELDPQGRRILYHHIGGVTTGMEVVWRIEPAGEVTHVSIDHDLAAPGRLLRLPAAEFVAGRFFVSAIADRTLRGVKRQAEALARQEIS